MIFDNVVVYDDTVTPEKEAVARLRRAHRKLDAINASWDAEAAEIDAEWANEDADAASYQQGYQDGYDEAISDVALGAEGKPASAPFDVSEVTVK